jgi:cyclopropane fatty-acyl-phospholipid synthase-like methyltransferase
VTDDSALRDRLTLPRFPRSATYDPQWMVANAMGPNPLWLTEWLCQRLPLEPGMRVLDLGCGRAVTSIFLAREYGVDVTAADLWVRPDENWSRIVAAGLAGRVTPVHAEAHDLPFAPGYFDAIVSVDAYHYFGTDDLYIGYLTRFLVRGGPLGIVVPSVTEELTEIPEHLRPFWNWEFMSFHSPQWWRGRWTLSGKVTVETADWLADGWRDWLLWADVCAEHSDSERVRDNARNEAAALRADAGSTLGFARVVGRVPA